MVISCSEEDTLVEPEDHQREGGEEIEGRKEGRTERSNGQKRDNERALIVATPEDLTGKKEEDPLSLIPQLKSLPQHLQQRHLLGP